MGNGARVARFGSKPVTAGVFRAAVVSIAVSLGIAGLPGAGMAGEPDPRGVHPEHRWAVEISVLAVGGGLLAIGNPLDVTRKDVPPQGLDPATIHWSFDRHSIGDVSVRADRDSDYFRAAAVAYPVALSLVSLPAGERLKGTAKRSLVYVESLVVAEGISWVVKNSADRPRPFTYLPASRRPNDPAYNVNSDEAFRSMPSGHATSSFCGAGFASVDHVLSRPGASWEEHAGVGFVGGMLAGVTAGLRREGGQHFPSDTMVGALIGTACGVAAPLLHRYVDANNSPIPAPAAHDWWQTFGGEAVGVAVGLLIAEIY